jgi:hypothetical protein
MVSMKLQELRAFVCHVDPSHHHGLRSIPNLNAIETAAQVGLQNLVPDVGEETRRQHGLALCRAEATGRDRAKENHWFPSQRSMTAGHQGQDGLSGRREFQRRHPGQAAAYA